MNKKQNLEMIPERDSPFQDYLFRETERDTEILKTAILKNIDFLKTDYNELSQTLHLYYLPKICFDLRFCRSLPCKTLI